MKDKLVCLIGWIVLLISVFWEMKYRRIEIQSSFLYINILGYLLPVRKERQACLPNRLNCITYKWFLRSMKCKKVEIWSSFLYIIIFGYLLPVFKEKQACLPNRLIWIAYMCILRSLECKKVEIRSSFLSISISLAICYQFVKKASLFA